MIYQPDCTFPEEILEQIAAEGLDDLPKLISMLINEAMRLERDQHLGAGPYERSPERRGHANGYKPKMIKTRVGEIQFEVPLVRQGNFYPDALEKGLRSERALTLALAEMYVQGVSTRRVAADIRVVFNAPDRAQAERYLKQIVSKYADVVSEQRIGWGLEGLTVLDFPKAHRRRIRTSNMLERVSQEIKRRTRVVRIFPNPSSCLRLVSAILMEISED
jgi:transposase-like protein